MSTKVVDTNLDEGVLHNSEWVHRWAVGNTEFHNEKPNPFLDANENMMFEEKSKSIFLPLCGKTPDILWMYNKGHTVCGVEIAEQPIQELFEENNIDKDVEQIENVGTLYKSKDGRLKLYVADLFDLSQSECGQFDMIWDSKSLIAINLVDHSIRPHKPHRKFKLSVSTLIKQYPQLQHMCNYQTMYFLKDIAQERYKDLMLALLKPDGAYYLATFEYDPTVWPGPPHSLSDKLVRDLYDKRCDIKLVEESKRSGQKPVSNDVEAENPHPSALDAIKTSSYICNRWYKMVLKQ